MTFTRSIALIALSVLLAVPSLHAETSQPVALTLEECLERAIAASPAMQSARIAVKTAHMMQSTAFDPEPTNVEFGQETTTGASLDNGFNISQDFDFPTLYFARHKALKAETAVARSEMDIEASRICSEVMMAYNNMLYTRRVYELRLELDSSLRTFNRVADARFSEGQTSRLEQINAQRIHESNHLQLNRAQADYEAACAAMQSLLASDEPIAPTDIRYAPLSLPEPAGEIDYTATPQGRLADSRIELGKRNLTVAKQSYLPGLSMGVTTQLVVKSFNPYHVDREPFAPGNFLGFTVGVKVPLFFGATRARERAAKLEVERLKQEQTQAQTVFKAEYRAARSEYEACLKALNYYTNTGLKHAQEIERLSVVSYDLSEISYTEHIQNLEAAIGIRIEHADAINNLNKAIINLRNIQGL